MNTEFRQWGYYNVNYSESGLKLKELVILPNKKTSYQKHEERSEFWIVKSGIATIVLEDNIIVMNKGDIITIKVDQWHQIVNNENIDLVITELQFGSNCVEEDIVRKDEIK